MGDNLFNKQTRTADKRQALAYDTCRCYVLPVGVNVVLPCRLLNNKYLAN